MYVWRNKDFLGKKKHNYNTIIITLKISINSLLTSNVSINVPKYLIVLCNAYVVLFGFKNFILIRMQSPNTAFGWYP